MTERVGVACDQCLELAAVFRLTGGDAPALCYCMACAVAAGWPWFVTETPKKRGRTT